MVSVVMEVNNKTRQLLGSTELSVVEAQTTEERRYGMQWTFICDI
jgi:hypothetical protein